MCWWRSWGASAPQTTPGYAISPPPRHRTVCVPVW